eukprot:CAMPEP_0184866716 /NCGR_PEP_ID=MMETSP0580-20130426/23410_1 /TAXON_ID=1118495 /ORGANISM="Dactyliosolen fragilissimus" /LENGTH=528 /DNA_ID=CAMNT_0027366539 /DNA_START=422 /DNA_END=2008 /DNA_ORIENTATION=-
MQVIGLGSMGEVSVVRKKNVPGFGSNHGSLTSSAISTRCNSERLFACKTVSTECMKPFEIKEFMNEIDILRDLDHPNILFLQEVFRSGRKIWIVTELCCGGTLSDRCFSSIWMGEGAVIIILEQILRAIKYMHGRKLCHRDIKLENIMFVSPDSDNFDVKLIDFGLSQALPKSSSKKDLINRAYGTAYSLAPEIILDSCAYNEQADMWSVGVVAYLLLSSTYPFLENIEQLDFPLYRDKLAGAKLSYGQEWKKRKISWGGDKFVKSTLMRNPKDRWSAGNALQYIQQVWISSLDGFNEDTQENNLIALEECFDRTLSLSDTVDTICSDNSEDGITTSNLFRSSVQKTRRRRRTRMDSNMVECMANFSKYGELKKRILLATAHSMDKSNLQELSDIFQTIDIHNEGTITSEDLQTALHSMHKGKHTLDDIRIKAIFEGADVDQSGKIHYHEFLAALVESQGVVTSNHFVDAFNRIDTDKKGFISKQDLRDLLGTDYNESLVDQMLEEGDIKKDGQVDYDEFLILMSNKS